MGKNGIAKFLRFQTGFHRTADQWKAEIVLKIMDAFNLETVTPKQVGDFFEHSPQKGSIICTTAGLRKVIPKNEEKQSITNNTHRAIYALEEAVVKRGSFDVAYEVLKDQLEQEEAVA